MTGIFFGFVLAIALIGTGIYLFLKNNKKKREALLKTMSESMIEALDNKNM